jgi:hypothetical protein
MGKRIALPYGEAKFPDLPLETLEEARSLYEKSGNLRGQVYCLVKSSRLNYQPLGNLDKAAQLFRQACDIGRTENTPMVAHFLSERSWLAPKSPAEWLKESSARIQKEPGLRNTRYHMLLDQVEKYRAMLEQESDPVLRIRAHWDLLESLSEGDRQTQALEEADAAIKLARLQTYDMAAYGGFFYGAYGGPFYPAVPFMLIARAKSKIHWECFAKPKAIVWKPFAYLKRRPLIPMETSLNR